MGHPKASVVTARISAYHALIHAHTGTHLPLLTQALEAIIMRISLSLSLSEMIKLTKPIP